MIEIDIPTIDPIRHEPKIFLGMTSRQCICIVPGVLLAVAAFMAFINISQDLAVVSAGICIAPSICLGWVAPYNMRFEQYVKLWWFNNFVAEPKRIYKTDEAVVEKQMTMKELQAAEQKRKAQELAEKKKKKESKSKKEAQ